MLLRSKKSLTLVVSLLVIAFGVIWFLSVSSAPQKTAEPERFIISLDSELSEVIVKLKSDGFIKNRFAFKLALRLKGDGEVKPGGYEISKSMNVWTVAEVLAAEPYMKWIVIPEGRRKEQIARLLVENLGWTEAVKEKWMSVDTAQKSDYEEGVYFPDTYLIPVDEPPADVASRLINRFNEKFAPFLVEAQKQNIRWPTVIKIASLIERETGGKTDMALISGIIWNRLLKNMKLDIDATIQYARDSALSQNSPNSNIEWWTPLTAEDKKIDSKFNTYKYSGLPPRPIANPGLDAIEAVLNPEETDCFYYLHASDKKIYCAATYEEHKQNIKKYLKNQ